MTKKNYGRKMDGLLHIQTFFKKISSIFINKRSSYIILHKKLVKVYKLSACIHLLDFKSLKNFILCYWKRGLS